MVFWYFFLLEKRRHFVIICHIKFELKNRLNFHIKSQKQKKLEKWNKVENFHIKNDNIWNIKEDPVKFIFKGDYNI